MYSGLERLSRNIANDIDVELQRIGVLYRIFSRAKNEESIERKLEKKDYKKSNKKMQDLIGIRVVVYFKDDLPLVLKALKSKFTFIDETIDEAKETVFEPNRINLIFKLNEDYANEVNEVAVKKYKYIDTTYEIQLRTILSEGWHEIEHDLRYKCQEDWRNQQELSRILNGIYAALETNDWSILSLFDQLAYFHYKEKNLEAMMRNKFRIRFLNEPINVELFEIINNEEFLFKSIFRIDRTELLNKIFDNGIKFPLTMNNLIYIINRLYIKNSSIKVITPPHLLKK